MHDPGNLICDWIPFVHKGIPAIGVARCSRCGRYLNHPIGAALETFEGKCGQKAIKVKPRTDCRHLGPRLRLEECDTCQGKTQLKILACGLHRECTIGKKLGNLACCAACENYVPLTANSDENPAIIAAKGTVPL